MIIKATDNKFFLLLPRSCSEIEFIAAARVLTGSPAAELASRFYCCLFNSSADVVREYNKYYREEYSDLWSFLFWHHSIGSDIINKIRNAYSSSRSHLLHGDVYGGGDYVAGQYIMSEEGLKTMDKILGKVLKEPKK
jgi:hypothetical protein